jgi:hypothetical protein
MVSARVSTPTIVGIVFSSSHEPRSITFSKCEGRFAMCFITAPATHARGCCETVRETP